ncbi:MAG: hypothetical protein EXR92_02360 [Gemmatimonadetes bacterium]|nr:hypothetical protein [Gemmatimonadota bacterium]
MLFRRYGSSVHRVEPTFDPNAINEISFRRDRSHAFPTADLGARYEKVREVTVGGETEGPVQTEAEARLLEGMRLELERLSAQLGEGEILVVENEQGIDHPKVRDRKEGIIEEGKNRVFFHWRADPPLQIGVYRRLAP